MTAPARTAAYRALSEVAAGSADPAGALAHGRGLLPDERDRALATDIVTGTLRWQRALDHLIERAAGRALATIDVEVLLILRMSLYQLLHLDRVPAAAVVDDAVDLTRAARKTSAAGFVNAVLRTLSRQRRQVDLPPRPAGAASTREALDYLGITQSHPEWLVRRWLDRYGFDAAARWVEFNNAAPALTLRANRLRTSRDELRRELAEQEIDAEPTAFAPDGLLVRSGRALGGTRTGHFLVQDEASQLVPLVVDARPGEYVLDLCAAPGGKTTALAADMGDTGVLLACDTRPRRMRLLRDTVRAAGATSIRLLQVDTDGALPFSAVFDRILVDAPCSGLGTLRRDPDIRWRRSEAELEGFARRQSALLARAAHALKSGGRLVYATCSSEPEENEQVVDAFLSQHGDYAVEDIRLINPAVLGPLADERGMLRTLPFAHGLEAFFAAALRRR